MGFLANYIIRSNKKLPHPSQVQLLLVGPSGNSGVGMRMKRGSWVRGLRSLLGVRCVLLTTMSPVPSSLPVAIHLSFIHLANIHRSSTGSWDFSSKAMKKTDKNLHSGSLNPCELVLQQLGSTP